MYVWNDYDPIMMKAVPYFCNSHLIANLQIGSTTTGNTDVFQPTNTPVVSVNPVDKVMSSADMQTALQMANSNQAHRILKFGRGQGGWTINGQTWDTAKIAAADVGQNTWEVWRLETGGGWFHPVHIHLIDMFVIRSVGGDGSLPSLGFIYVGVTYFIWGNTFVEGSAIARGCANSGDEIKDDEEGGFSDDGTATDGPPPRVIKDDPPA